MLDWVPKGLNEVICARLRRSNTYFHCEINNPNWSHVAKIQRKYDRLPRSVMENLVDRREKMCRIQLTEDAVKMMSSIESKKETGRSVIHVYE